MPRGITAEVRCRLSILLLALAVAGCGGSTPTSPTTPTPNPSTSFTLSGQVTDSATGAGISAATVAIVDGPNASKSATTDSSGSYSFSGLQQSGFTVNVSAANYVPQSKPVTLTANLTMSFQLTHQPTAPPPPPISCTFTLSVGATIDGYPNGGSFPVTVTTSTGCAWTAASAASWIHVIGQGGTGTGTVTLNEDANDSGATRTGVVTIAGRTITFNQTALAPPAPPGGFAGVRYDNISISHEFIVGTPVPTQNVTSTYCCWPLPVRNGGSYTFNLANFPLDVLPSGGNSNVISASEMVLVGLNASPATGLMTFEWHRAITQDVVISTFSGSPGYAWTFSYIGHFSWEMNAPGSYYVVVGSPWGSARLDFLVTGSSTSTARGLGRVSAPPTIRQNGGGGPATRVKGSS